MAWIAALFFAVALCYSSVGFGGGSSYTAILVWQGEGADTIRQVSLLCNLVVVVIGGIASWKVIRWSLMAPLLLSSIPAVFYAARWRLSDDVFFTVLAVALVVGGLLLIWKAPRSHSFRKPSTPILLVLGSGLGTLAGVTGIGGGIYLAPVLHLLRAGGAREIAAVSTWFILLNSLVGFTVITSGMGMAGVQNHLWLPVAVAAGGLLGSRLLQGSFHEGIIRRVTGILILVVAGRLILQ
jgi:uncharacterized membrane protein YfcA